TATTEIYTLSLHDALPISRKQLCLYHDVDAHTRPDGICHALDRASLYRPTAAVVRRQPREPWSSPAVRPVTSVRTSGLALRIPRSEEHTSELQSLAYLVCR